MATDRLYLVCNECAEAGKPSTIMLAAWLLGFSRTPEAEQLEVFLDLHEWHGFQDYREGGIARAFSLANDHDFELRNLIFTDNSNVVVDLGVTDAPIEEIILQAAKGDL